MCTTAMKQVCHSKRFGINFKHFMTFLTFAGVNYRQLPRKGYVVGNSSAPGAKVAKERLTVMIWQEKNENCKL